MRLYLLLLPAFLFVAIKACDAFSTMSISATSAKHILFDIPVSNNGGKCRIIAYKVRNKSGSASESNLPLFVRCWTHPPVKSHSLERTPGIRSLCDVSCRTRWIQIRRIFGNQPAGESSCAKMCVDGSFPRWIGHCCKIFDVHVCQPGPQFSAR